MSPTPTAAGPDPGLEAPPRQEVRPLPPRDPTLDVSQNHYWRYQRLDQLLSAKQPVTESVDEDLFIAVHQVCELAFHQMILDLERALAALRAAFAAPDRPVGDVSEACYFLRRVVPFWDVVNRVMPILSGMRGFAEFRHAIGPGSGFQSAQFRRIEIMAGVRRVYWAGATRDARGALHPAEIAFEERHGEDVAAWLATYREHSLAHYWEVLRGRAEGMTERLLDHPAARALMELLARYEAAQKRFHDLHVGLAARQLALVGVEVGTGGSNFKDYLATYGREVAPLFEGLPQVAPASA